MQARFELELDDDARIDSALQHARERLQQRAHIDHLRLQHLPAREGQQLGRQLGAALGGPQRGADHRGRHGIGVRSGVFLQDLQVA